MSDQQPLFNDGDQLLNVRKAINFLSISRTTFYRRIKDGVLPRPKYIGSTPLWKVSDLRSIYNNLPTRSVTKS